MYRANSSYKESQDCNWRHSTYWNSPSVLLVSFDYCSIIMLCDVLPLWMHTGKISCLVWKNLPYAVIFSKDLALITMWSPYQTAFLSLRFLHGCSSSPKGRSKETSNHTYLLTPICYREWSKEPILHWDDCTSKCISVRRTNYSPNFWENCYPTRIITDANDPVW